MIRFEDIQETVKGHHPEADLEILRKAYIFSAVEHKGQVRASGEPYLVHPLEVANILAEMRMDPICVAVGLLHDILEDTLTTPDRIQEYFGADVFHIVEGVTKISKIPYATTEERQAETYRKMLLAMADDIRVILIKLADRLHNMRTLDFHSEKKRKKIAQETHDIYAPISGRLGIYWIKKELEDTAFKYLQPEEYHKIKRLVRKDQEEREKYIESVKTVLKEEMENNNLNCEVLGRYKYYFSIYQKMLDQDLPFEEIYDVIAFRIILDTIPNCYEALGLIHALWKPVPKKFKDYIGVPKPNMYQSLHTTVIGPFGERIETQIRTRGMDKVAESGIAAHWSYKEDSNIDDNINEAFAWIKTWSRIRKISGIRTSFWKMSGSTFFLMMSMFLHRVER